MVVGRDRAADLRPVPSLELCHLFSSQSRHVLAAHLLSGGRIFRGGLFPVLLAEWLALAPSCDSLGCRCRLVAIAGGVRAVVFAICMIFPGSDVYDELRPEWESELAITIS